MTYDPQGKCCLASARMHQIDGMVVGEVFAVDADEHPENVRRVAHNICLDDGCGCSCLVLLWRAIL